MPGDQQSSNALSTPASSGNSTNSQPENAAAPPLTGRSAYQINSNKIGIRTTLAKLSISSLHGRKYRHGQPSLLKDQIRSSAQDSLQKWFTIKGDPKNYFPGMADNWIEVVLKPRAGESERDTLKRQESLLLQYRQMEVAINHRPAVKDHHGSMDVSRDDYEFEILAGQRRVFVAAAAHKKWATKGFDKLTMYVYDRRLLKRPGELHNVLLGSSQQCAGCQYSVLEVLQGSFFLEFDPLAVTELVAHAPPSSGRTGTDLPVRDRAVFQHRLLKWTQLTKTNKHGPICVIKPPVAAEIAQALKQEVVRVTVKRACANWFIAQQLEDSGTEIWKHFHRYNAADLSMRLLDAMDDILRPLANHTASLAGFAKFRGAAPDSKEHTVWKALLKGLREMSPVVLGEGNTASFCRESVQAEVDRILAKLKKGKAPTGLAQNELINEPTWSELLSSLWLAMWPPYIVLAMSQIRVPFFTLFKCKEGVYTIQGFIPTLSEFTSLHRRHVKGALEDGIVRMIRNCGEEEYGDWGGQSEKASSKLGFSRQLKLVIGVGTATQQLVEALVPFPIPIQIILHEWRAANGDSNAGKREAFDTHRYGGLLLEQLAGEDYYQTILGMLKPHLANQIRVNVFAGKPGPLAAAPELPHLSGTSTILDQDLWSSMPIPPAKRPLASGSDSEFEQDAYAHSSRQERLFQDDRDDNDGIDPETEEPYEHALSQQLLKDQQQRDEATPGPSFSSSETVMTAKRRKAEPHMVQDSLTSKAGSRKSQPPLPPTLARISLLEAGNATIPREERPSASGVNEHWAALNKFRGSAEWALIGLLLSRTQEFRLTGRNLQELMDRLFKMMEETPWESSKATLPQQNVHDLVQWWDTWSMVPAENPLYSWNMITLLLEHDESWERLETVDHGDSEMADAADNNDRILVPSTMSVYDLDEHPHPPAAKNAHSQRFSSLDMEEDEWGIGPSSDADHIDQVDSKSN